MGPGDRMLSVTDGRAEVLCLPQDIDADGDVDLLAEWGHYGNADGTSRVFRNDGRMNFTDVTAAAGLPQEATAIKGVGDVDQDGDPDLICLERRREFAVYLNDGRGHFTKKDGAAVASEKGAALASWGVAVTTDFDNDGAADILVNGKHFLKILQAPAAGTSSTSTPPGVFADLSGLVGRRRTLLRRHRQRRRSGHRGLRLDRRPTPHRRLSQRSAGTELAPRVAGRTKW